MHAQRAWNENIEHDQKIRIGNKRLDTVEANVFSEFKVEEHRIKDWDRHDKGAYGKWLEGVPSASKTGKLSAGGSPKAKHVLYKLSDGANGTGLDAVWRANLANNEGEQFAIIEVKASRDEDAPKFMRKLNNT